MRRIHDLKSTVAFLAVTILLVAVSAFCITGTVMSSNKTWEGEMESYYREQEKEMLCSTRKQLESMGYADCGVTLTRMVDEMGNREYTFTVHHRKIERMSEEERQELAAGLADGLQLLENCSVCHEFLVCN